MSNQTDIKKKHKGDEKGDGEKKHKQHTPREPVQFIPIKTGEVFTDNNITSKDGKTFTVTSSSHFSDTYKPFNAFNGSKDNTIFWQSNTAPNPNSPVPTVTRPKVPNPYTQPPYDGNDGSYVGGGRDNGYFFSTNIKNVNNNTISNGEWLQIQLPSPVLLTSYSVLTPSQQGKLNYFPQEFTLAGSEDGTSWNYIDYQNLASNDYTCLDRKPVSFTVSNIAPYSYFRLIINKMPINNTMVRINQFNLSGIYPKESFTGMFSSNILNPQFYDSYPSLHTFSSNFSQFSISEPMIGQGSYYPLLLSDEAILETTILSDTSYEDDRFFVGTLIVILAGTFLYTLVSAT